MRLSLLLLLTACSGAPDGLRRTPQGPGPVVAIDWDAEPLPELPFPNDLATRADPTSITGLRVNISVEAAPTELERRTRRKLNGLTGFGVYAPISVAFEAPLDLDEIVRRHAPDLDLSDDAFYLIDVTPGSPTYLQPVELDVGHGRYPQDIADPLAYFPNDVHVDTPSLLFDTHDEDTNGNGVMDPGEDIDGDGYLDVPNVLPLGGDPREDLLTWYERLTNTLIFRPIEPLREQTTYAVILTERLVGEDGNPVRSPWEWVNHTRQTDALRPVLSALPELGLSRDDIAYAWTFTTARVTGDLVDIRRGLDGEGPWPDLGDEFPPGVSEALQVHSMASLGDFYNMPVPTLIGVLSLAGIIDDSAIDTLEGGYAFGESMVAGAFTSPDFLADRDDGGYDAVDEWFELDPVAGTYSAQQNRVTFTCVLPKETPEHQQPFPVVMHGHGYGSNRLEAFMFAWAFLPYGIATCAMDFPGHGAAVDAEQEAELFALLDPIGLWPFFEHLQDARFTDTDNDGNPDSGSHQWTADAFHTRDMVRQAVVDWMWMHAAFKSCGSGTMTKGAATAVSCDWDGDGVPDIGGPDADYMMDGGSLGGINLGVAAAVMPGVKAFAPIVAGGGLMDISTRAPTGGAVEAMHGKLMSPLFLGYPDDAGGLDVYQMADNYQSMVQAHVGHLDSVPAGGMVRVENLDNGEVKEIIIPSDGRFRVGIAADALDYFERREPSGMPLAGPELGSGPFSVPDNEGLGDRLRVTLSDADGAEVAVLDSFDADGLFQGVTYPAGSPLVAMGAGLGRIRASPQMRKLFSVVSMALEPGDPIAYAPYWVERPIASLGGEVHNVMLVPTPGDMVVSVNSEIALARAAGFIERHQVDPRYGMTIDDWLIDRQVVRGLEEFGPWRGNGGAPVLFDPEDFDRGINEFGEPSDAPLRISIPTEAGVSGVRMPYAEPTGSHGFGLPDPSREFDIGAFAINQLARYLASRGQIISDERCMEDSSCRWMPQAEANQ